MTRSYLEGMIDYPTEADMLRWVFRYAQISLVLEALIQTHRELGTATPDQLALMSLFRQDALLALAQDAREQEARLERYRQEWLDAHPLTNQES
jgi:hypothetical protein